MTGTIYAISVLVALVCVLAPGWALREITETFGLRFRRTGASSFLTPFAFGVHLNALWFLVAWVVSPGPSKHALLIATLSVDLALIGVGIALRSRRALPVFRDLRIPSRLVMVAGLGILIGSFASIQIPSVLDSIQIRQLLNFLMGWGWSPADLATHGAFARMVGLLNGSIPCPPMPGFAGIMMVPGILLDAWPVTTVSAGMKVLLVVMAGLSVTHLVERLGLRPRLAVVLIAFICLVLSRYGLYGMLNLGKDSIFAVPLFVASIGSLVGDKTGRHRHEASLYFSAAIFLGSVVVPYGLVFWAIYMTLSLGRARLIPDLASLLGWTVLALPVAVAGVQTSLEGGGAHHLPLIGMIGLQFIAACGFVAWSRRCRSVENGRAWLSPVAPSIPLVAFGLGFLLMPAIAKIVVWADAFGNPVTEVRSPLDGRTNFYHFLTRAYDENLKLLIIIAVFGCITLPWMNKRYRTPAAVAMFSFLPVTLVLVLLHLKLGLHSLTAFNIWDITKNVPQWFVGTLFAAVAILTIFTFTGPLLTAARRREGPARMIMAIPAVVIGIVMLLDIQRPEFRDALKNDVLAAPTVTSAGGFSDPDVAEAEAFIWNSARGKAVFVSSDSVFMNAFYQYQMYGAVDTLEFNVKILNADFQKKYPQVGFLVNANDMLQVLDFALHLQASIAASKTHNHHYLLLVKFDGKGLVSGTGLAESSVFINMGAHAVERSGEEYFRWVGKEVDLTVIAPMVQGSTCFDLRMFNPSNEARTIDVIANGKRDSIELSAEHTLQSPRLVSSLCAAMAGGRGTVHLRVSGSDHPFANDGRAIALGLMWPVMLRTQPPAQ